MKKFIVKQLYNGSSIFVITKKDVKKIYGILKVRGTEYEDSWCQVFDEYQSEELKDSTLEKLEHEAIKKFFKVK